MLAWKELSFAFTLVEKQQPPKQPKAKAAKRRYMEHISKLSKARIILSNKMSVPIGRTYINKLTEEFSKYSTRFDA